MMRTTTALAVSRVLATSPAILLACSAGCVGVDHAARPNIVILYTDDQGYGDFAAANPSAKFATPNMDRIAREGMLFTDGHSAGSVCTPSRYALLTGRYAWRLANGGRVVGADLDGLIDDDRTTVASLLRGRGYATGIVGKWHLGLQVPGTVGDRDWSLPVLDGPRQKGFDEFYGLPASMNFGVLTWFDGDRAVEPASLWTRKKFPESEITVRPLHYRMAPPYDAERQGPADIEVASGFRDVDSLRIIAEHSVDFIERHARQPFFLYVAFTSPHLPHCTAPEFRGVSGMGNYGDFVAETDHRVGQILEALDRVGAAQHTLVLFTSDNGPENNHRDWARIYDHACSGGFRGGKRDVYEGGHRVPFAVRWPGVVAAGTTCDAPVGQVDVLATVAEVVGAELGGGQAEDSRSFAMELRGRETQREPLLHYGRGRFAIRDGRWKLIFGKNGAQIGTPEELYDLAADPIEADNRLDEHPSLVERLTDRAHSIRGGSRAAGAQPAGPRD